MAFSRFRFQGLNVAEILFTHSYFLHFDTKEHRAMMPYPPLGTLYAASYLRESGFSVALHDVMLMRNENEIKESISSHKPQFVVIYDDQFNYLTKMCLSRMREASFTMTRIAKQAGCKVCIFSSDSSDHLEKYFENGADYVICGEAEESLAELCKKILHERSKDISQIRGIAYVEKGQIVRTVKRPVLENLDVLPFPAWDLIEIERYRQAWVGRHGFFSLNMVTTRGCPFHCNWCAKPIYGQVYHTRTPRNVVAEMAFLASHAKMDHIWFADDIFGLSPGWIAEFDDIVNKQQAVIPFKCLSRADLLLKEDTIMHLKHSGCKTVWIGAESGSQKVLDAMEKGVTVDQIYKSSEILHKKGIQVGFFLQYGYPGETRADIEKTLEMVKNCRPDEIGVSVSYPLPGTRFHESVKRDLVEKQNWVDSGDLDMMFQGTYGREYYRILHKVTHKKFRIWRGMIATQEILHQPSRLGQRSLRSIASMVYHGMTLPLELRKLQKLERTPSHVN